MDFGENRTNTRPADGVYKAGFAITQGAYEKAVVPIFNSLDRLEKMLTGKDYLIGDVLTEADIRLWVTIVRLFLGIYAHVSSKARILRFVSILFTSATSSATFAPSAMDTLPLTRKFIDTCHGILLMVLQLDEEALLEQRELQRLHRFPTYQDTLLYIPSLGEPY